MADDQPKIAVPARVLVVEVGEGDSREVLGLQIEIDCPACGALRYAIPGHHARALRDMLIDHCDAYPSDREGPLRRTGQYRIPVGGPQSQKPEEN